MQQDVPDFEISTQTRIDPVSGTCHIEFTEREARTERRSKTMARYILIDSNSGYIFGDTADFGGSIYPALDICDAAREMDEKIVGEHGRSYLFYPGQDPRDSRTGYRVYRADVRGSEQVPVVQDGQDPDMIEAVERDCEYVGFVEVARAAE